MVQRVVIERLLPIAPDVEAPAGPPADDRYLYEPAPEQLFEHLLPDPVEVQVFRALLESNAASTPRR